LVARRTEPMSWSEEPSFSVRVYLRRRRRRKEKEKEKEKKKRKGVRKQLVREPRPR